MPRSLNPLLWLTLGAFSIGTEGFMIAGLLPALAQDLNVGLSAAGHLITAFSLAYAIGAPVMAVLTARLERRRLLAIAMAGFSIANLLAALAPGYAGLLAARLLLVEQVILSRVLTFTGLSSHWESPNSSCLSSASTAHIYLTRLDDIAPPDETHGSKRRFVS
jgi:MFS family permease